MGIYSFKNVRLSPIPLKRKRSRLLTFFNLLLTIYTIQISTMKTKFILQSSLMQLALSVCIASTFTACSCDDDSDINSLLSEETTTIDFEFSGYSYHYGTANILYDFAGNNLVGSDTIYKSSCTLNLRQGKHHLIWINGLWPTNSWMTDIEREKKSGVYFDPQTKTITNYYPDGNTDHVIVYCEKDLEVSPYLLPIQKIEYKHVTCVLRIEVTDNARWLTWYPSQTGQKGRITGVPSVKSVSLDNNKYTLNDVTLQSDSISRYEDDVNRFFMLCPSEGIDDIQPVAEIIDQDGRLIEVNRMPKFSLRRGYITTLRGPLLTGTISDWTVTMEPYRE